MKPSVVQSHFDSCVVDVCLTDDENRTPLCQAIEAYVTECQHTGTLVPVWRRPHFCGKLSHDLPCFCDFKIV